MASIPVVSGTLSLGGIKYPFFNRPGFQPCTDPDPAPLPRQIRANAADGTSLVSSTGEVDPLVRTEVAQNVGMITRTIPPYLNKTNRTTSRRINIIADGATVRVMGTGGVLFVDNPFVAPTPELFVPPGATLSLQSTPVAPNAVATEYAFLIAF